MGKLNYEINNNHKMFAKSIGLAALATFAAALQIEAQASSNPLQNEYNYRQYEVTMMC